MRERQNSTQMYLRRRPRPANRSLAWSGSYLSDNMHGSSTRTSQADKSTQRARLTTRIAQDRKVSQVRRGGAKGLFKSNYSRFVPGLIHQTVQIDGYQQEIWYIYELKTPGKNFEERKNEGGERQREEGGAGLLLLHAGGDGDGDVLVRGVDNRRAGEDRGVGDTRALGEEDCQAATNASATGLV